MTTKPRFKILFAAAVAVALLLPSFADAAGQNKGNRKNWHEQESVQQKLGLTADQVARIGEIEETYGTRLIEMNQEKRTAYRILMTSLDAGELPEEEFNANRARLEAAFGSHAAVTADRWLALRRVLTEQQWRKLPEAAPRALALGPISVSRRAGVFMGPGSQNTPTNPK
jgi:Spy/CpxP family protein refolding chaperone